MSSELLTITLLYPVRLKPLSMDKIALNTLTSNWRTEISYRIRFLNNKFIKAFLIDLASL